MVYFQSDAFKSLFFCALLALQFGLQPLISSRFVNSNVDKASIVAATELEKILISAVIISTSPAAVKEKIIENWNIRNSLAIAALPACLYTIQNIFVQYSYVLIDSMTFNLLNQTKTISAAIWLYIMLNQKQSYMQIVALAMVLMAAVILNTPTTIAPTPTVSVDTMSYHFGVAYVLAASLISGLSGTLTQKALISPKPRHTAFLSGEMAVYSIIILLAKRILFEKNLNMLTLFEGWTIWTLIPVTTNAFGGIIIGFVTKYAGGVKKGFALIVGILVTAFAQWVIEGKPLRIPDWFALVLVCISINLHSSFPLPKDPVPTTTANSKKVHSNLPHDIHTKSTTTTTPAATIITKKAKNQKKKKN